jgi:hypothetical protein
MTWADIPRNPSAKMLRQFAVAWLVFFGILAARLYYRGHHTAGEIVAVVAIVVGMVGLVKPLFVKRVFVTWMILAFPMGWFVSQVMLLVMYYVFLTPVALVFRLMGRDLLMRKRQPKRASYWVPKQTPRDVRSYFRQH